MWWWTPTAFALTCDQVFDHLSRGTPEAEIVQLIRLGPDMTTTDLKCLDAGSASRAIMAAAEWRVAKSAAPAPAPSPRVGIGTPAPRPAPSGPAGGKRVDVEILGVTFAPGKPDGTSWDMDGTGAAVVGTVGGIATIGNPVAGRLGQLGMQGLAAPDPVGWVQWLPEAGDDRSGLNRRLLLDGKQDTYRPEWTPGPSFRGIPLTPTTRFRVHVWDDDRGAPDDVPAFDVGSDVLRRALDAGGIATVPVGRASNGAITHVSVRVRPSSMSDIHVDGATAP